VTVDVHERRAAHSTSNCPRTTVHSHLTPSSHAIHGTLFMMAPIGPPTLAAIPYTGERDCVSKRPCQPHRRPQRSRYTHDGAEPGTGKPALRHDRPNLRRLCLDTYRLIDGHTLSHTSADASSAPPGAAPPTHALPPRFTHPLGACAVSRAILHA
jgi:hypothetical protein